MTAYYNENDPYLVQWIKNLIEAGLIAPGEIDNRSILDVSPRDLKGYSQYHFFAGIGGWSFALRLAEWPDEKPAWTGSCPCQDFSLIGKRAGFAGHRDLWPTWFRLIRECRPDCIFGEQVDGSPEWIDRTASDLEGIHYACAPMVIPACAIGSPQERARLFFAAYSNQTRWANLERIATPKTKSEKRRTFGVAYRQAFADFQWPTEPDPSWIVDGLSGEGRAVSAFGNAIIPQVTAVFIMSAEEARLSHGF